MFETEILRDAETTEAYWSRLTTIIMFAWPA